jgi:hypothetical protein
MQFKNPDKNQISASTKRTKSNESTAVTLKQPSCRGLLCSQELHFVCF